MKRHNGEKVSFHRILFIRIPWVNRINGKICAIVQGDLLGSLQDQRLQSPQWPTVGWGTRGSSSCSTQEARSCRTTGIKVPAKDQDWGSGKSLENCPQASELEAEEIGRPMSKSHSSQRFSEWLVLFKNICQLLSLSSMQATSPLVADKHNQGESSCHLLAYMPFTYRHTQSKLYQSAKLFFT